MPDASILDEFQQRASEKCRPLSTTIELTLRCNIRCAHCYNFDRETPYPRSAQGRELSDEEIHRLLDDLREEGCLYLGFTGGEALLHASIYSFVRHGARLKMSVLVKTNGTLLSPRVVSRLSRSGCSGVDVSLHGGTAATHDRFTGVVGSFDKSLAGARAARDAGLKVHLSFSLGMHDAHEAEEMRDVGEREGVGYGMDPYLTGRYDGKMDPLRFRMDRATLERLYRGPLADSLSEPHNDLDAAPQCACARTVCGISSTGIVWPCIGAPVPSGSLRERPFREIWRESPQLNRIRGLTLDDFKTCKPCPHRAWCKRSSGVVYANTGEYTGPEAFTCMEAEVRHALHDEGLGQAGSGDTVVERATLDRRLRGGRLKDQ